MKGETTVHLTPALVDSQSAAPHPACGHLLPRAEKDLSSEEGFITKEEIAPRLKVSVRTIEQWQYDGHLPYLKLGQVVLFYWPEVVKHLTANFTVRRASPAATDSNGNGGAR